MTNLKTFSKILLMSLLFSAATIFAQTGIKVTFYSGSAQDYTIETSGKLYFSGSNLLIKTSSSAADVSVPTNIIRKITFTTAVLSTQEIGQNKDKFALYPNPASDFIQISSDKKDKMKVKIYSSTGRMVHSGTYLPKESINISELAPGFYLVQVDQTTIKLIKK